MKDGLTYKVSNSRVLRYWLSSKAKFRLKAFWMHPKKIKIKPQPEKNQADSN